MQFQRRGLTRRFSFVTFSLLGELKLDLRAGERRWVGCDHFGIKINDLRFEGVLMRFFSDLPYRFLQVQLRDHSFASAALQLNYDYEINPAYYQN